jgi:hypothetical protein
VKPHHPHLILQQLRSVHIDGLFSMKRGLLRRLHGPRCLVYFSLFPMVTYQGYVSPLYISPHHPLLTIRDGGTSISLNLFILQAGFDHSFLSRVSWPSLKSALSNNIANAFFPLNFYAKCRIYLFHHVCYN